MAKYSDKLSSEMREQWLLGGRENGSGNQRRSLMRCREIERKRPKPCEETTPHSSNERRQIPKGGVWKDSGSRRVGPGV